MISKLSKLKRREVKIPEEDTMNEDSPKENTNGVQDINSDDWG